MNAPQLQCLPPSPDDAWLMPLFQAMLAKTLSERDFEAAVEARWRTLDFVAHAPETCAWLSDVVKGADWNDAGYAHASPKLGFRSHYLVGVPGQPGAVYIEAPAEKSGRSGLHRLNRPVHQHDSGRIAAILSGRAIFHVSVHRDGQDIVLDCPVEAGDIVFWPAWTPHTFDARDGFGLISAMASYVSPALDGFVFPVEDSVLDLPRQDYIASRAS